MEVTTGMLVALVVGIAPLLGSILWWWNDIRYALPIAFHCSRSGTKLPPGYMGLPFLGELLHFLYFFTILRRPEDFINAKRRKYGDGVGLYRTYLFGSPAIIACSPSANKFIFQSDADFFLEWPTVEVVGSNSLAAVQGASHTRIRSFVLKAVSHPDSLRRIALMVQPRIVAALQSWAQKGKVVVSVEAKKVIFQNIGKFFAGFEPGPVLDTLDELFAAMVNGIQSSPINLPGTAYRHALQCRKKVVEIFKKEMDKRKNEWNTGSAENDLLDGLMRLKDDGGNQLRDAEVLDNIIILVIAGYDSTSLSVMWAMYYLAKYPNVLKKLREEHNSISKSGDFITREEIIKLKYTNQVVEETIRMANIATAIFRTAAKDVDYKGYRIPKGWKMMCWARYLHTDPDNFEDPMSFNPDRWNEQPKPGSYLAFGGGSRLCAGNMLARLQVAIFIHHLILGYRWELVNPDAGMSYLPNPKPRDGVEITINKL